MPISKDCASDQIVIYQPFIYRRHSGYGWKSECLKLAFPNARVVTDCSIIRGFDGIVIALRGITSENAFYRPPFYYPKEIAALSTVKGKVVLYTSWEFDTLPASVSNLIPIAASSDLQSKTCHTRQSLAEPIALVVCSILRAEGICRHGSNFGQFCRENTE
jgi:hypothetical protein